MDHLSKNILAALAANRDCGIHDLLREKRVLMTRRGVMSYGNDRELVALVADAILVPGWPSSLWLGHVLRVDPAGILPADRGRGEWVALLVQPSVYPRGSTEQEVFEAVMDILQFRGQYDPCCYCFQQEDVFQLCHTFEEACAALTGMIKRFDPVLMGDYAPEDRDYIPPQYRGMKCSMHAMDVYGLPCLEEVKKADVEIAGRRALHMAKGEGWIDEVRRLQALAEESG